MLLSSCAFVVYHSLCSCVLFVGFSFVVIVLSVMQLELGEVRSRGSCRLVRDEKMGQEERRWKWWEECSGEEDESWE